MNIDIDRSLRKKNIMFKIKNKELFYFTAIGPICFLYQDHLDY